VTTAPTPRRRRPPRSTRVRAVERLSASLVRVVVGGTDLADFAPEHADSYVKVLFLHPDVDYARPLDLDQIKESQPPEYWPRQRSYTVRRWDPANLELTLDFVVHGDSGIAGPWAASAQVGDEVLLQGPGGAYSPDPSVDWHLLVGDESALPAIAVALERLPADARALVFVEVHGADDELSLTAPSGAHVVWLHRGDTAVGSRVVDAVRDAEFLPGRVHAFVHGEAGFVKDLRRFLRIERQLPLEQLSISGYWRYGVDDEGWRATKADWNRQVEAAEVS
jgi:NADPH-dependent ferric siderophore reductase